MINVETVIGQLLKPLKDEGQFGFYHFGNEYELKEVFASKKYNVKYPIIWLVLPLEGQPKENLLANRLDCRIKLILATSTNKSWLNDKRNIETYEKVLNPLFDEVVKTFTESSAILVKQNEVNVKKLHNYYERSQGTRENPPKRQVNDYWDVILLEFNANLRSLTPCELQEKPKVTASILIINGKALIINSNRAIIV